jgi:hypothetical protein
VASSSSWTAASIAADVVVDQFAQRDGLELMRSCRFLDTPSLWRLPPVAACQGGRLVVHFTNRKNARSLFSTRTGTRPDFPVEPFALVSRANQAATVLAVTIRCNRFDRVCNRRVRSSP